MVLIKKDILLRYFSGKYSLKDYRHVQEQFLENEKQQDLKSGLNEHWMHFELSEQQKRSDLNFLLSKIQHRLYLEENEKARKLRPLQYFQRIAAILFIPLFLGFSAYFIATKYSSKQVSYAEIQCPDGVRTEFMLPDGSSGFLNNGSTLKYPIPFDKDRNVTLVGEAFFDVKHDGTPFHVKTKSLDVKVMGTTFNVVAYKNDKKEEVTLQTGKVRVSSNKGNPLSVLNPNQQFVFNTEDKNYYTRNVEATQYSSWSKGMLVFRNETLDNVAKKIGRWYNVDVEITNERLKNYTFHATFLDQSLTDVLELLKYTSPISYKIVKSKSNGTNEFLNKQKVILELDQSRVDRYK